MSTITEVFRMSPTDKIGAAMDRSLKHLPGETRGVVAAFLKPETLAIIAGTLVVWAGSHFFGVGEIVDVILLGVGIVTLGFSVFEGADELYKFCTTAINARSENDFEISGKHFARAVTLLGVSVIQAILLRGQGRAIVSRGRPQIHLRPSVGLPPANGARLNVSRPNWITGGSLGETTPYGIIKVARNQSLTEQRITLFHELVHRYFSPRVGPFKQFRAEMSMSAYSKSALLCYLEEALAEGYAQLRVHGLSSVGSIKISPPMRIRNHISDGYRRIRNRDDYTWWGRVPSFHLSWPHAQT